MAILYISLIIDLAFVFNWFFILFLGLQQCSIPHSYISTTFLLFGDKFENNSIITKHIVPIYIQFIFKNYQIATSLLIGAIKMSTISINYTHHNFNEVFPFNVFWMCPVVNLLSSVGINWSLTSLLKHLHWPKFRFST